jgi:hypothetical protein
VVDLLDAVTGAAEMHVVIDDQRSLRGQIGRAGRETRASPGRRERP